MIVTITRCDTIAVIIDNRDSIWIGNVIYEHYARSISVHYLHVITTKWLTEMTQRACVVFVLSLRTDVLPWWVLNLPYYP